MLVVGLTGGIGSGKSTVAKLFSDKGVTVIDTDQLAHHLTLPGKNALHLIVEKFGESILLADHTLDRAQLRKKIFAEPSQRRWLEELLHPLIRAEVQRLIQSAHSPYCIVIIPLLLETKPNPLIQRILVVDTTEEQQIMRTKKRDGLSEKEIQMIMATQVTRKKRLEAANDIILNQDGLAQLTQQVETLHKMYLEVVGDEKT